MLDTIKIFTKEYKLNDTNKFITIKKIINEFKTEYIYKHYYNNKLSTIDISNDTLFYSVSIPKLLYKTNLFAITEDDYELTVEKIITEINNAGISLPNNNLNDFEISRVDFCKNIEVIKHPKEYLEYLTGFQYPWATKTKYFNETLLFHNKSRELVFYNKFKEFKAKEKDQNLRIKFYSYPENILRIESRLKNKRVIKEVFKRDLKIIDLFNYQQAKQHLVNEFNKLKITEKIL